MTRTGWMVVGLVGVVVALAVVSHFIRHSGRRPFPWLRRILDIPVGMPAPPPQRLAELYYRPYPPRLSLNVPALILGPVWYLLAGLWVHVTILAMIVGLSGGLLAPLVWLYCGLKANEDLLEFRVARQSVY